MNPGVPDVVVMWCWGFCAVGVSAITLYRISVLLAAWVRWWGRVHHELRGLR